MVNDQNDNFDELDEEELKKRGISITDIAKKVFAVGIGAAFLTEESIRNALGEFKLPKEILNTLRNDIIENKICYLFY